ncbi:MAG: adenylate/guanylate cyclase domain-containing protein [Deltaproteobacteria bacterium]|nr:adenylate/guanylate cyclase domain-containing protein [Deltaproteobacteria bacterium]
MKIGIKIKLALVLSGLLFLTAFSIGGVLIMHQRSSLEAQMRSMAGTITHEFASDAKIPLMQKDTLQMNLLVQSILKYPGIHDAFILNDNLQIEAHKEIPELGLTFYEGKDLITRTEGSAPWLVKEGDGVLTFVSPIIFKKTTVGYTAVSFSDAFIKERVALAIKRVAVIGVLAVIGLSLLSIPLSSRLLRPVFKLFTGTKEIAKGNLDYRIPDGGKDEIGDLVDSFNRMASELKKKEILKGVFNRYVSAHVADEILKEPDQIRLGGDRREVTVLFADIRGFTSISKRLRPEETVELLNSYFTFITEIVFRFEGTIDKFIGDAVMSVFGAPIRSSAHLEQGVKAAIGIKLAVTEVNKIREARGLVALKMGVGLDSGTVIAGNMGSQARMDYTAVGDAVNMASRLTDLAKGGDVLVSEEVYNLVADNVTGTRIDSVFIKGIDGPVTLYNISGLRGRWKEDVADILGVAIPELERQGVVL